MTKWYALNWKGEIEYVGSNLVDFDDADKAAPANYVWLMDEVWARRWLAQLQELLS